MEGPGASDEVLVTLKCGIFNGISSQKWATSRYFPKKQEQGPTSPPGGDASGWEYQDDRIAKYMGQVFLSLTS